MYRKLRDEYNLDKINNTSTPKRRRLSTGNIVSNNSNIALYKTTTKHGNELHHGNPGYLSPSVTDRAISQSPPLPCNQVEYLNESAANNNELVENISVIQEIESDHWEVPVLPSINHDNFTITNVNKPNLQTKDVHQELEDISDDMFQSNIEFNDCNIEKDDQTCNFGNTRKLADNTFDQLNETLCNINSKKENSFLFETNDSFHLYIKDPENSIVNHESSDKRNVGKEYHNKPHTEQYLVQGASNNFYGLPEAVKNLFKIYRNITKFYEWQEECLSLESIKKRHNLIYSLPTSGGKTLVAEVLMLREVLNNHRNALFILPYVAIVQEKIFALSPFAVQLDFLVEEYAGGKGLLPPKKRKKKNSIYIATIEKGLALIRNLIELERLNEIGIIVVDELHLIGEVGRGATQEALLTTVMFAKPSIQIVGMSATIGNLSEIAEFLNADVYQRDFRPVDLSEYVKLGTQLFKLQWTASGFEVVPDRQLAYQYSAAAKALDPDYVGGLVSEVVPTDSCLVFCATKRSCENVAAMLATLQRKEMMEYKTPDRCVLEAALKAEGAAGALVRGVRSGVAYHHAGLANDERKLLEDAFRNGTISVLCCTSTLAAGVNLPARRVLVRAPYVARSLLTLSAYRQMTGRAGRTGLADTGESILMCSEREWSEVREMLSGGLAAVRSALSSSLRGLLLSAVGLRLATTRATLRKLLSATLLRVQAHVLKVDMNSACDDAIRGLITSGALEAAQQELVADTSVLHVSDREPPQSKRPRSSTCLVYNDSQLHVSKLGRAAINGCMELSVAKHLCADLQQAAHGLVLMGTLHLFYLVTPHDVVAIGIRPDYRNYYNLYMELDEEGLQTAKILGITEMNAIRMITGKPITTIPEVVLHRFYAGLILRDLWRQFPLGSLAEKYMVSRGSIQSLMCCAASFASSASRFTEEVPSLWGFTALLAEVGTRLRHCAAPDLQQLMELPAVKKTRALQLHRAGFKRVEDIARTQPAALAAAVPHLSHTAASHLVSAAKMMLIEKVENLRAEAEEVMEHLNV